MAPYRAREEERVDEVVRGRVGVRVRGMEGDVQATNHNNAGLGVEGALKKSKGES